MPYARAVTLLEDLPPMVQMENPEWDGELDLKVGSMDIDVSEQQPHGVRSINMNREVKRNPFFDEVVQEYPQIERKIRKDTDLSPYETYLQTSPATKKQSATAVPKDPRDFRESGVAAEYTQPGNGYYQLKKNVPPSGIKQNYLNQDMIPVREEQHMPVANQQQSHYNSVLSYGRTYPVVPVEHYENKAPPAPTCKDIAEHIHDCPVCSILYKKNDKMYIGIIIALALLIFLLVWKLNK